MTTIINLLGLYTLIRLTFKAFRLFAGRQGKKHKGAITKIFTLASRGINYRLDAVLKKQGEAHGYTGKVIPMKRYKKKAHGGA
jgi:hypothetical protein